MKNNSFELMSLKELANYFVSEFQKREEAKHGRSECAWCKKDMGVCLGLARGLVSHGICPTCSAVMRAEFAA